MAKLTLDKELLSKIDFLTLEVNSIKKLIGIGSFISPAFLASIQLGGSFPRGFEDQIEKQRTENCKVTVDVNVSYLLKGQTQNADGVVCTRYEITTRITVTETCSPGGSVVKGTTTHVSEKVFCGTAIDERNTGQTTGFKGKQTDTLTYGHGTKVTVVKDGARITITVVFPDGTTETLSVPES
ncbi:MAG: hypothetical protein CVV22_12280 [Ignavibacteriae bacterium HGW-Ignavibacteriae-1]|nr:MAG: hypothetical protein CVV22_12280 [Ignavibacteriae bacterium HGW-Ignavibacteriae-1]